jgi:hypothetical protein
MKVYQLRNFILVFFVIFIASSCKERKLEKLETKWRLVEFNRNSPTIDFVQIWDFNDGNLLTTMYHPDTPEILDTVTTCNYTMTLNVDNTEITLFKCSDPDYNGRWFVTTLQKEFLTILCKRDNRYELLEFVKH